MIRKRTIYGVLTGLDLVLMLSGVVLLMLTMGLVALDLQDTSRQKQQGAELMLRFAEQQTLLRELTARTAPEAAASAQGLESLHRWRAAAQQSIERLSGQAQQMESSALAGPVSDVQRHWQTAIARLDRVLVSETELVELQHHSEQMTASLTELAAHLEELIGRQVAGGEVPEGVAPMLGLLGDAQDLARALDRLRTGGLTAVSSPAPIAAALDRFAVDLGRLPADEPEMGSPAMLGSAGQDRLQPLASRVALLRRASETMIQLLQRTAPAASSLTALIAERSRLTESLDALMQAFAASQTPRTGMLGAASLTTVSTAVLTIALLGLLAWRGLTQVRRPAPVEAGEYGSDQRAILRLLDEVGGIAEGDLSVAATPGDDLTGAIADAFNQAIAGLRKMVTWGSAAVHALAQSTAQIRSLAGRLEAASASQGQSLMAMNAALDELDAQIAALTQRSAESAATARRLVERSEGGADSLRDALQGMDVIREQARQASARLERLTEGAHEIGAVSATIDDLADQTDILAVNGAMQAANAGESGRQFVGLIDEVRELARQTREASHRIQAVLRNVTADAVELASLIETTGDDLQRGGALVAGTGEVIAEIESLGRDIDRLLLDGEGSLGTGAVDRQAERFKGPLDQIQESTRQLAADAKLAGQVVTALSQPVQELRRAVAGFRLAE